MELSVYIWGGFVGGYITILAFSVLRREVVFVNLYC